MATHPLVFVLFNGANRNTKDWDIRIHTDDKNVIDTPKKRFENMGNVYTVKFDIYNHCTTTPIEDRNYALYDEYIEGDYDDGFGEIKGISAKDLDIMDVCKKIYTDVRKKFPNGELVPVGHSMGFAFAITFSRMYAKECKFAVSLDGIPNVLKSCNDWFTDFSVIIVDFARDKSIKSVNELGDIIENGSNKMNPYQEKIIDSIVNKWLNFYRYKYFSYKLAVPTLFFRCALDHEPLGDWNFHCYAEELKLKQFNDTKMYEYHKALFNPHFSFAYKSEFME